MKHRILTVSSANMDLVAQMKAVPSGGETIMGEAYEYVGGGKGANSAIAFSRLGAESIFAARVGEDTNGDSLIGMWRESGIDTRFIVRDPKTKTGLAVILVEESGQNRIVVYPGANTKLAPPDVEEAFTCYPDALFLQFEIPIQTALYAVSFANSRNIPVFVDAGPAVRDFPLEELGRLEVFSPNESETYAYTGIRPSGAESCFKACLALENRVKAKYYVLKLGDRGCFLYDGMHYKFFTPYDIKAVDSTAAGDAFTAALTLEYLRSGDIDRALIYANVVGSITVSRLGASASIPAEKEVETFISQRGIQLKAR